MDKKLFESTEFYTKRYDNFSTLIIIPTLVLFLVIFIVILLGKVDITVTGNGSVLPNRLINVNITKNRHIIYKVTNNMIVKKNQTILKYDNGRSIKSPVDGIVYQNNSEKIIRIYPTINKKNGLVTKVYVSGKDIGSINKGQRAFITLPNNNKSIVISGYVKDYSLIPNTYHNNSYYEVICYLSPKELVDKGVLYGMNGKVTIITNKVSILEYLKSAFS